MNELLRAFRDLHHSLSEYPAEWSDDALAEISNVAAAVKGAADTEMLIRATGAYDHDTPARRGVTNVRGL